MRGKASSSAAVPDLPPGHAHSERSSPPLFLRARQYATRAESRGHGAPASSPGGGLRPASLERRSPTGIAGAPVSDRHRAGARNPPQQRRPPPISLLRTAYRRSALNRGDMERWPVLPVGASDRHRAGARNPPQQRRPPPISLLRTAYRRSALNRGDMERWPVLPVGASDRHRAAARNPHQQRCALPISLLRTAYRRSALNRGGTLERRSPTGIARQRETSADDGAPYRRKWRTPCSIRTALFAALRAAVPTRGRRSLAGASWCPWGYPPRCVARRLAPRPEGDRAVAPLSHFPPDPAGGEPKVRHHCFCALGSTPTTQNHADMERRSPTGIARERETRPNNAAPDRAGARNPPRQRRPPPT